MWPDIALFFFGLLVSLIVMMGLVPFYLMAYLEQAEREGSAIPDAVRWLRRVFGLEALDDLPARVRSEPNP
jgi:hypothetical protein